jgi:LPXTG-motif cell wall-anchored protein
MYENCDAVEAALGRAILAGEPGYGPHLDNGGEPGVGCEHLGFVPPGSSGGKLPLTGVALPVVGGAGVALLMVGAGLLLYLRRRNRLEFVAE